MGRAQLSGGGLLGELMRKPNSGRVVVVTGASAGVGRATVRAFAREGAHVGLIARDTEGLHVAAREVEQLGGKGLAVPADVADADQVEAAAARIEDELGPIDVWVNNAMTTVFARVADVTPAEFKRATEVTYLGTVYGTMAALRRMLPRNAGRIIQVGSALAYRSIPLQAAYCGAKHAIAGFTDSLRTELIHDRQEYSPDDGAASGHEHAAVHLVPLENAESSSARAADLPAGSGGRNESSGPRITTAAKSSSARPRSSPSKPTNSLRRSPTIISAAPALIRSRHRNPSRRIGRTIYSNPCPATSAPMACSGSRRMRSRDHLACASTKEQRRWQELPYSARSPSRSRDGHRKERKARGKENG